MDDRKGKNDIQKSSWIYRKHKRKSSLNGQHIGKTPFFNVQLFGNTSLYILWNYIVKRAKKASMTIEAALVLPLFFFGMITMISFMDVYKLQTEHLSQLCQRAKEAGMYAYRTGGGETTEITLPDIYRYKPVSPAFPLPSIWMHNTVKVHAWTGEDRNLSGFSDSETVEAMVYVTQAGSVYHKSPDCRYLNVSAVGVAGSCVSLKRNEYGEKYHACERCSWNQEPGSTVYITNTGNRYHNSKNCSGLKRTVRLIKESEAENLRPCSRCG